MADFLLEVRTEEIPANALPGTRRQLLKSMGKLLKDAGFSESEIEIFSTSRRLAILITGLPLSQEDRVEELTGPPTRVAFDENGSPTRAAEGFARKAGIPLEEIRRIQTDRGEYLAATVTQLGRKTTDIFAEGIPQIFSGLKFPKTMRWGAGDVVFVRPVHGVLALFDNEVVPLELFGFTAGRRTIGHRVHSPSEIDIPQASDYEKIMETRGVLVRPSRRKALLDHRATELAAAINTTVHDDPGLVSEHVELVEYPGLILGRIEEKYLELPPEVVISTLRYHQKCLILEDEQQQLQPYFLAVIDRKDDPENLIRIGNEWVIGARLADARFFFEEDLKRGMQTLVPGLKKVEWHRVLGSLEDKAERISKIAGFINENLGLQLNSLEIASGARLVKADLLTNMVNEFTDLQGIMGGHYLRIEQAPAELWTAARDHYRPVGFEGPIPTSILGRILGLADRMDSIAGLFAVGEKPTGSRDPLGLRRAAQACVKILAETGWRLPIDDLIQFPLDLVGKAQEKEKDKAALGDFFFDRVRRFLVDIEGVSGDTADAVMAAGWNILPECIARARALEEIRQGEDFRKLALAFKRVQNITEGQTGDKIDPELFADPAEEELFVVTRDFGTRLKELLPAHQIRDAFDAMLPISEKLENFFVEVLVMADDEAIRANRIALLKDLGAEFLALADLSKLQVEGS